VGAVAGRPVAVVTGAAHGIGLETARRLAATHRVALLDLDEAGASAAAQGIGGDALAVACDVTDPGSLALAERTVLDACGGVDVVIANAGIAVSGTLRHLDPAVLDVQLRVNLSGAWRSIHAFLPSVIERRGYVLGVASLAAIVPSPGLGAYSASKAGLDALLHVLRQELHHLGVGVGVAYFAFIDTDMVRGAEREHPDFARMRAEQRGPVAKVLPVGEAADAIVRGVAERSAQVVAPRWVAPLGRLRGLVAPLAALQGRRMAAIVDRATAENVAERGPLAAGLRRDHAPSEAALRSVEQPTASAPR
jgi:NAD(P)-dependent dehydrogenase (short-subunit alcohol dehydrogenase family)